MWRLSVRPALRGTAPATSPVQRGLGEGRDDRRHRTQPEDAGSQCLGFRLPPVRPHEDDEKGYPRTISDSHAFTDSPGMLVRNAAGRMSLTFHPTLNEF
jgi:hypothetical protein